MTHDVETVDTGSRRVTRRMTVETTPSEIFALLADPHRHGELDGSGTVRDAVSGPHRVALGDRFAVNMRQLGIPYRITSTVVEDEEDRLIAWRHPVGHVWRWELEPDPEGTVVTETFDYSTTLAAPMFELSGRPARNAGGIEETLRRLGARFAGHGG
ncbi:SRPBCC family protein [Actinomycetospora sp. NBRC 106378]|uniref:SRPBCC family protein n=1 Tax=Actinomycetospora sp. NBRC 106378 TaxID=3032208 RepID=UPI0024A492E8|nr:SRPBCC family protein [Actinomycetospora sp. NBRC 106378]GLZ54077.1 hypothetical protein Acsp07_36940 [Actinomycetospora sp. NBRC 106378]